MKAWAAALSLALREFSSEENLIPSEEKYFSSEENFILSEGILFLPEEKPCAPKENALALPGKANCTAGRWHRPWLAGARLQNGQPMGEATGPHRRLPWRLHITYLGKS